MRCVPNLINLLVTRPTIITKLGLTFTSHMITSINLLNPPKTTRTAFRVPLQPHLGCIFSVVLVLDVVGVASPAGVEGSETIDTGLRMTFCACEVGCVFYSSGGKPFWGGQTVVFDNLAC
jgi:hypothetical protein